MKSNLHITDHVHKVTICFAAGTFHASPLESLLSSSAVTQQSYQCCLLKIPALLPL
jgi:hypothetical protein